MSKITKEHIEAFKAGDIKGELVDTNIHKLLHRRGLFKNPPIVTIHVNNLVDLMNEYAEQVRKDERVKVMEELKESLSEMEYNTVKWILTQLKETK